MLGDQRAQLADQVRVAPACQVSREPLLDRLHPQLLQASDLVLRELVETMIRQCLPSPQCQRFAQIGRGARRLVPIELDPCAVEELLETAGVDRRGVDLEGVARRPMAQRRSFTQVQAQTRDLLVQRMDGARGNLVTP